MRDFVCRSIAIALGLTACAAKRDEGEQDSGLFSSGGPASAGPGSAEDTSVGDSADEATASASATGGTSADATSAVSDTDAPKFDVFAGDGGGVADDGGRIGCQKVDFLFLVDNSGSMEDEQEALLASFPGFISTIQNTLMAQDYHIMAIDTDASAAGGISIMCAPAPQCCDQNCQFNPGASCNGMPCTPANEMCDAVLGAGRNDDLAGDMCAIQGAQRYLVDGQNDLPGTFECIARTGTGGDGNEQQMAALLGAIGDPLNAAGQCNEGFVRDDAVLVLTVMTDEEDDPNDGNDPDPNSPGNPQSWHDEVVAIKNGDPDAVVVLGLVGDPDVNGGVCPPLDGTIGAEAAPRLRQFVELFGDNGLWASICNPDYSSFFEEAVLKIDAACDGFEPPG
jgi:hypothetical protein